MSAMRMAAEIRYDLGLVALSYAIAAGASMAALRLSLTTMNLWQRAAGACAMGAAVAGMHYTGMAAATFVGVDRPGPAAALSNLDEMALALAVSVTTFLVLFLASAASIVDRRMATREAAVLRAGEDRYRNLYETLQQETAHREQAEATLRQVQRMETVGQLTGGIAHDFNNILTVVIGNLDSLLRRLPEDEALRQTANSALRSALRAADLTQRLLAFGRRQTLAPRPVSVNRLILGTSDVLSRTIGESTAIETILPPQVWTCLIDPNQLEAALINLALNARDAMPQGGRLRIETANMHFDETFAARYEGIEAGDYVMVAVSDTGIGIPKENIGKVFEPFFTTKEVGRGSGLGLAQVYGFVRQSGGLVTVDSEVGVGTTVRLYLRRAAVAEADPAEPPADASMPPRARTRETILLVEDDEAVRGYTAGVLEDLGYEIVEAADAMAALAILRGGREIDLVFTDIGLPGMNGRKLAAEARRLRPWLKVLYTTGYAGVAPSGEERLEAANAPLVQKPFTRELVAERVRLALDGVIAAE
jgi:signal transduction histidine kinase